MILWRFAADTRADRADDLSGAGAARSPGRRNDAGQPVLCTAPTIARAVLETAAHIDDGGLPLNRYLVEITVPDATWAAIPAGRGSVKPGSDWLKAGTAALLVVPSVIVPEEPVVIVNTRHPDAAGLQARTVRLFAYNRLFRGA